MSFNIREGIRQALLANSAIVALVGQRIYATYAPTGVNQVGPWIVFTKINGGEEMAMSGDQQLTHPVYQFEVGGTGKVNVDEVLRLLTNMVGTNYLYTVDAVDHYLLFVYRDDRDGWDDGTRVYGPSVDFEIWANKT